MPVVLLEPLFLERGGDLNDEFLPAAREGHIGEPTVKLHLTDLADKLFAQHRFDVLTGC